MAQSSVRVDVISGFEFQASKGRRAFPVTGISNSLTPRDTNHPPEELWSGLSAGHWKLSSQSFSISGSPKKGKLKIQGRASVRTVQNYVLAGKSKRILFQRRGAEGTKRRAEAVNIKEMLNIQPGQQQPHWFCILSILEQEGWAQRPGNTELFFSRASAALTDLRAPWMPVEPCSNTSGCSQPLTHLAHETKWNRNMSWEWEWKCDFMALWSRRHSIYSCRLERRGCQRNENKNNLRSVCRVIFHLHQALDFIFYISYAKPCLVITADRPCAWKIYSVFLGFIHPCKNRKPLVLFSP